MSALLKDVAEKANTSITTVSLVLNNKPVRVSKKKKDLILKIAKELEYKPNQMAQSLVTKRTMTIGLIIPDIRNLFFTELVRSIGSNLRKLNYSLLLCNSDNLVDEDVYQMELLRLKSVDGIFVVFSDTNIEKYENEIRRLRAENIPVVIMDRYIDDVDVPYVGVDDKRGGYLATKYLIECNHKEIACITGARYSISSKNRFEGYCQAMKEAGLAIKQEYIFHGNFEFSSGERLAENILEYPEITAVFAENDMMALGLYRGMSKYGKRVGKDISVIGYDDIVFSSMLDVPLTTMNQNVEDVAKKAVDVLMAIIHKNPIDSSKILSEPTLVVRDSVRIL